MKLVMAVSADGYVARDGNDDMSWTGHLDKAVFRILTSVGPEPLAVGRRTKIIMPRTLPGRNMFTISSSGLGDGSLDEYYNRYRDGWLIGGQTVALAAKERGMISEVHLCRTGAVLEGGIPFDKRLLLDMTLRLATNIYKELGNSDGLSVERYR